MFKGSFVNEGMGSVVGEPQGTLGMITSSLQQNTQKRMLTQPLLGADTVLLTLLILLPVDVDLAFSGCRPTFPFGSLIVSCPGYLRCWFLAPTLLLPLGFELLCPGDTGDGFQM